MKIEKLKEIVSVTQEASKLLGSEQKHATDNAKKIFTHFHTISVALMDRLDIRADLKDLVPANRLGELYQAVRSIHGTSSFSNQSSPKLKKTINTITEILENTISINSHQVDQKEKNEITIFYSWQNDLDSKLNRFFIRDCLKDALKKLSYETEYGESVRFDSDTTGVPGTPDIASTIFEKISTCSVFIADVSFCTSSQKRGKYFPNSNVMIELGFALAKISGTGVLNIMNTAYGEPENLPFDLKHRRWPVQYQLTKELFEDQKKRKDIKDKLTKELFEYMKIILDAKLELRLDLADINTNSDKQLLQIVKDELLLALKSFFAPFRYAVWLHRMTEGIQPDPQWSIHTIHGYFVARREQPNRKAVKVPTALDLEEYVAANLNWPNIFSDLLHAPYPDDKNTYSNIFCYEIFDFPWLHRFQTPHPRTKLTVLDLFKTCTSWADEAFAKTISRYGNFLPAQLLAAIAELTTDREYQFWTNLPDGLSHPGYGSDKKDSRLAKLIEKGIFVRDLVHDG